MGTKNMKWTHALTVSLGLGLLLLGCGTAATVETEAPGAPDNSAARLDAASQAHLAQLRKSSDGDVQAVVADGAVSDSEYQALVDRSLTCFAKATAGLEVKVEGPRRQKDSRLLPWGVSGKAEDMDKAALAQRECQSPLGPVETQIAIDSLPRGAEFSQLVKSLLSCLKDRGKSVEFDDEAIVRKMVIANAEVAGGGKATIEPTADDQLRLASVFDAVCADQVPRLFMK